MVWLDHPEYFWMSEESHYTNYTQGDDRWVDIEFAYLMSAEEQARTQQQLDLLLDPLVDRLAPLSEWDRLKGVYDYIINNSIYRASGEDQSLVTLLLHGEGVCAAYAKATQYLLDKLEIRNLFISGSAGGDGHAWNIVQLYGDNYELDTTWGDPLADDGHQELMYDYFCLTTQEMCVDHVRPAEYILPVCTATQCEYYRWNGLYFTAYDPEIMYSLVKNALWTGEPVTMKFSDAALYRSVVDRLFGQRLEINDMVLRYQEETGDIVPMIWHTENEAPCTLKIYR